MMRRDIRGRFRKPTDEERWPDPADRARMQRIRTYFELAKAAYLDGMAARLDDIKALRGKVWDAAV